MASNTNPRAGDYPKHAAGNESLVVNESLKRKRNNSTAERKGEDVSESRKAISNLITAFTELSDVDQNRFFISPDVIRATSSHVRLKHLQFFVHHVSNLKKKASETAKARNDTLQKGPNHNVQTNKPDGEKEGKEAPFEDQGEQQALKDEFVKLGENKRQKAIGVKNLDQQSPEQSKVIDIKAKETETWLRENSPVEAPKDSIGEAIAKVKQDSVKEPKQETQKLALDSYKLKEEPLSPRPAKKVFGNITGEVNSPNTQVQENGENQQSEMEDVYPERIGNVKLESTEADHQIPNPPPEKPTSDDTDDEDNLFEELATTAEMKTLFRLEDEVIVSQAFSIKDGEKLEKPRSQTPSPEPEANELTEAKAGENQIAVVTSGKTRGQQRKAAVKRAAAILAENKGLDRNKHHQKVDGYTSVQLEKDEFQVIVDFLLLTKSVIQQPEGFLDDLNYIQRIHVLFTAENIVETASKNILKFIPFRKTELLSTLDKPTAKILGQLSQADTDLSWGRIRGVYGLFYLADYFEKQLASMQEELPEEGRKRKTTIYENLIRGEKGLSHDNFEHFKTNNPEQLALAMRNWQDRRSIGDKFKKFVDVFGLGITMSMLYDDMRIFNPAKVGHSWSQGRFAALVGVLQLHEDFQRIQAFSRDLAPFFLKLIELTPKDGKELNRVQQEAIELVQQWRTTQL